MPGTWSKLVKSPDFAIGAMLLLTDGSVIAFECFDANLTDPAKRVCQLYPDELGNYLTGFWSALQSMHVSRRCFASAVLADGNVFVGGGEDSDARTTDIPDGKDTNTCELYDSANDKWISLAPPQGLGKLGDASCCVLADGRLLLGTCDSDVGAAVIFDPTSDLTKNCFTPAASKGTSNNEETWTLLPDGSVLTVECSNTPHSKRYIPGNPDKWVEAGNLGDIKDDAGNYVGLVQLSSKEIGPAILLPNGNVFAIGATGYTALYDPKSDKWTKGLVFKSAKDAGDGQKLKPMQAKDAPACLLPNGRVLCRWNPRKRASPTATIRVRRSSLNTTAQS